MSSNDFRQAACETIQKTSEGVQDGALLGAYLAAFLLFIIPHENYCDEPALPKESRTASYSIHRSMPRIYAFSASVGVFSALFATLELAKGLDKMWAARKREKIAPDGALTYAAKTPQ